MHQSQPASSHNQFFRVNKFEQNKIKIFIYLGVKVEPLEGVYSVGVFGDVVIHDRVKPVIKRIRFHDGFIVRVVKPLQYQRHLMSKIIVPDTLYNGLGGK